MNDLINRLTTFTNYSQFKDYVKNDVLPQLATRLVEINWNEINADAIRELCHIVFFIKPYNKDLNLNDLFCAIFTSLEHNERNTDLLSRPYGYDNTTFLGSMLRSKSIHPRAINLLLFKHRVDPIYIGGRNFRTNEVWNESALYLICREYFCRNHNPLNRRRFGVKLHIFLDYCIQNHIDLRECLETVAIDGMSALQMIQNPEHRDKIDSNQNLVRDFTHLQLI